MWNLTAEAEPSSGISRSQPGRQLPIATRYRATSMLGAGRGCDKGMGVVRRCRESGPSGNRNGLWCMIRAHTAHRRVRCLVARVPATEHVPRTGPRSTTCTLGRKCASVPLLQISQGEFGARSATQAPMRFCTSCGPSSVSASSAQLRHGKPRPREPGCAARLAVCRRPPQERQAAVVPRGAQGPDAARALLRCC